jgi:hypothetical protein
MLIAQWLSALAHRGCDVAEAIGRAVFLIRQLLCRAFANTIHHSRVGAVLSGLGAVCATLVMCAAAAR